MGDCQSLYNHFPCGIGSLYPGHITPDVACWNCVGQPTSECCTCAPSRLPRLSLTASDCPGDTVFYAPLPSNPTLKANAASRQLYAQFWGNSDLPAYFEKEYMSRSDPHSLFGYKETDLAQPNPSSMIGPYGAFADAMVNTCSLSVSIQGGF